ncbi:hypothetical protein CERZMDRAFT_91487 [Cercospora zeae-maydis SCOH1-5]|uniref:Uncharacterized protein n=1 Tax=Cercospora zeae-maydis SCOH1-5 TaxID=717836 RepID=A0A6A6F6U1_9PEZI|nr:hypothetical protein CERZMDRAFT_91487 [Cercospora zeae-maydis SCOH1-5]
MRFNGHYVTHDLTWSEQRYHWGLVVGPKAESPDSEGRLFRVRERMTVVGGVPTPAWEFEERATSMAPTAMVLIRILFGKVADIKRLESIIRSIPMKGMEPGWNCVIWLKDVMDGLRADGKALGTSVTDWSSIRDTAVQYVEAKTAQHRFDGQGQFDRSKVATWSLLDRKEVIA